MAGKEGKNPLKKSGGNGDGRKYNGLTVFFLYDINFCRLGYYYKSRMEAGMARKTGL